MEIKEIKTPEGVRKFIAGVAETNEPYQWNTESLAKHFKRAELISLYNAMYQRVDNPVTKLPLAGRRIDIMSEIRKYFIGMDRVKSMKP